MALVLKDRVKETTTTTGTGTITLAGAAAGFQSFAAVGDGNTTYYAIVDATSGAWEVGVGTYTASGTTLSRTTVLSSSNAGSLVSFAAGTKDVFVTYPSEEGVWQEGVQTLTNKTLTSPVITQNIQVISTNTTAVASRTYVFTATLTLTLPASPTAGDWVAVQNSSGTTTAVIGRNSSNIMSLAENMTLDAEFVAVTLVYADATRGWVFN